jgi:monoamine oxidase
MGATWLGKKHHHLWNLLDDFGIQREKQYMDGSAYFLPPDQEQPELMALPDDQDPSYRIVGGSAQLIDQLAAGLSRTTIHRNMSVTHLARKQKQLEIHTSKGVRTADLVISTLPPFLMQESLTFNPALPETLIRTARQTHTWMGESIKFGVLYDRPFWRKPGTTGTLFSQTGPIIEMYDHSRPDENFYALKGFVHPQLHTLTPQKRKQRVMEHLRNTYGDPADQVLRYVETDWREEAHTYRPYPDQPVPHQHNGAAVFRSSFWEGKLWLAGSETAEAFPGYMDGAVERGIRVAEQISQ